MINCIYYLASASVDSKYLLITGVIIFMRTCFASPQHLFSSALKFAAGPGKWVGAKIGIYALNSQKKEIKTAGYAEFIDFIVKPVHRENTHF
jgi:hypothetical protein